MIQSENLAEVRERYQIESSKACFYAMMNDASWGHLRMKWPLNSKGALNPPFHFPVGLIDGVTLTEFSSQESQRLPVFIGASHIGIYPKYSVIAPIPQGHLHFLISKSMLSGHVNGLSLQMWDQRRESFELIQKWTG